MIKLLLSSLMVAALCLALGGCETSDKTANSSTPKASQAKMTDSDLENSVKTKLDTDAQLKAVNLGVSADAETNQVTLSGTVDSEALRTRAIDLAKSAQAGILITDKIMVKPREMSRTDYTQEQAKQEREKGKSYGDKIGDTLDDAWIHTKIVAKLITNSNTPERKINVDVVNNVVTLRGTVDSTEQKAEAERVAKNTDGVKSVNNQLKVSGKMAATPTKK
ncbi:MAG: BON domain-containing protein [Acidobacteria bacterium]|nr:BON domain-containing protein [Acidobacteriota bacterium]